MSKPYHHGDLPSALRAATVELVTESGPSGFSLREVARRAGVSHAAPAHHFGDAQGLLTSVAAEGFEKLADALEAAGEGVDDARERLRRCGRAYVTTALANPGHFDVIFQNDLIDPNDESCLQASVRAYAALLRSVTMVRDQLNRELDVDAAATFCWAAMQGLVALSSKLEHVAGWTDTRTSPVEAIVDQFTEMMIDGFRAR